MKWVIGIVVITVALPLLLAFLPPIAIPEEIIRIFTNGMFKDVVTTIDYFLPVGFIFTCVIFLLSVRVFNFLASVFHFVIDKLGGN